MGKIQLRRYLDSLNDLAEKSRERAAKQSDKNRRIAQSKKKGK